MVAHNTAITKRISSRFRFFVDIVVELKKVVWLSRREVMYLTVLVLVVSVSAGIVLGGVDYGFSSLVEKVFLGR